MKTASLPLALLTLLLGSAAVGANDCSYSLSEGNYVYYYQGSQKVPICMKDLATKTGTEIDDICKKIVSSIDVVKAADRAAHANGALVQEYVRYNLDGLATTMNDNALFLTQELPGLSSSSNLDSIASETTRVEAHNAYAAYWRAVISRDEDDLMMAGGH